MTNETIIREFSIPLPSKHIAGLQIPFPMSVDDFRMLIDTLVLWEQILVKNTDDKLGPDSDVTNKSIKNLTEGANP